MPLFIWISIVISIIVGIVCAFKSDVISGFIDLGDSGIGDPWRDYAWCIWSLEYNLKSDAYTGLLIEKLGIEFDKEKFDRYIG
jgi:aminoglycoside phosphotransferase